MPKILIVEDDQTISKLIAASLSISGYESVPCFDGNEAVHMVRNEEFDLILLDIMLPGLDGFQVMEKIRETGTPVIFLTAMGDVSDRVKGLKSGAEDYIVKPFEIIELLARVETVLRRYNKTSQHLGVYDISVDTLSRVVKKGDKAVNLTMKEYDLLVLFLQNPNIALFRDRIYELVWGEPYMGDSRTVDLHVQRMRKKLGLEEKIVPVYKIGYRLEVDG